jgi:hypothetical protein
MNTFEMQAVQKNRDRLVKRKLSPTRELIVAFGSLGTMVVGAVVALALILKLLS